ncbi:MAG: SprT-like domain-containing protein [Nitrospiria bacterium]
MIDVVHRLKSAWIRQLKADWQAANATYFKNAMRLPSLDLSASEGILGRWKGGSRRCLSISRVLIENHPWACVQEVLYHEMAHQYVEEVLGIDGDAPHGTPFKRVCIEHGIDHRASGTMQDWIDRRKRVSNGQNKHHRMLNKVNKLLALAQSANTHEAESAMTKAHNLLLKHNLSLLDTHIERNYIHRQIGRVGRRNPIDSMIAAILSKFFFVETIWTFGYDQHEDKSGRILEIYGTPDNVEIAAYLYDYLKNTSASLWAQYREEQQLGGNRHRRTFINGLLEGFYRKLDKQAAVNRSKQLVWTGDPQLQAYYRQRNPRRIHTASRYSSSSKAVYRSGMDQGFKLVIRKGIHERKKEAPKLLGPQDM